MFFYVFFFSSRRRHTRYWRDWSSDVCSSDLQWHVGLIVWAAASHPQRATSLGDAVDEHRELETFVRRLAGNPGCAHAPPVVAVHRSTAWAWLPMCAASPPAAPSPDLSPLRAFAARSVPLRMTLGLPAHGEVGFRRTHEQAQQARSVALMAGARVPEAVSFGDEGVAIVAVLARDLPRTRVWVSEVLGRLAVDDESYAALRETM